MISTSSVSSGVLREVDCDINCSSKKVFLLILDGGASKIFCQSKSTMSATGCSIYTES